MLAKQPKIGAVVLAAGASRRLGEPKQLVEFESKTLLSRTIEVVNNAMIGPIVVVTGFAHDRISPMVETASDSGRITTIYNQNWNEGMGSSLSLGVRFLLEKAPDLEALVISVCDQPFINEELLERMIELFHTKPSSPVASTYGDSIGTPALFPRSYYCSLINIRGDRGAKALLTDPKAETTLIPFPKGATDIDTPEDYHSLLHSK
ncbi:MAG: nucleotidyltransferase family protein [Verrucomicrobiota bacterium]